MESTVSHLHDELPMWPSEYQYFSHLFLDPMSHRSLMAKTDGPPNATGPIHGCPAAHPDVCPYPLPMLEAMPAKTHPVVVVVITGSSPRHLLLAPR